ncbi:MAG: alpha/beta hydrolase, partial [Rhizobacter sp.]|nr:alpha/beta hydrolase [Rhizobacter sp.]
AANLHRVLCHYDVVADLPHIECPTLVVHCPDDGLCAFEEGRILASKIPGARLETFGGSNHTPLPTDPTFEPVNRLIDDFLQGTLKLRPVIASPASKVVELSVGGPGGLKAKDFRTG